MPRQLTFVIKRRRYSASPVKIDRRKLYGWTKIVAADDNAQPCQIVSTDETGQLIIPRGGTAVGLLSPRGEWVERSELRTVTADGKPAELLPSSFDTQIVLRQKASLEEYFDHNITDFYLLAGAPEELVQAVGEQIYTFRYCYTEGCAGNPAFVLAASGELFLLIGERLRFEMIGYEEPGFIGQDTDGDEAPEEEIDFSMF